MLERQGLAEQVVSRLGLKPGANDAAAWEDFVARLTNPSRTIRIGIVGKYVKLADAYLSVIESLRIAAAQEGAEVELKWIHADSEIEEEGAEQHLSDVDAVMVPGGFGLRGIEGKIAAIRYAREHKIPFLGLCLGMQTAVIEFARHVAGLGGANSAEFDPGTPYPVIDLLPEQKDVNGMGGTMRLGAYPCRLVPDTRARELYGTEQISERHRHRYEVNNALLPRLVEKGLVVSGTSPDGRLVEIVELRDHPYFVACQFHPEFKSRPNNPHPLFLGFVRATLALGDRAGAPLAAEVRP
ncbi:CTP synthase [compost metagenome]